VSGVKWSEAQVDLYLRSMSYEEVLPDAPAVSPVLRARTLSRLPRQRTPWAWKGAAAAAVAICLLLASGSHATWAGMAEIILGIPVRVLNMSPDEWLRQSFSNWLAAGPETEFLSPEETAAAAPFPIRTPAWVPEGFAADDEPRGAYPWGYHPGEGWKLSEDAADFFVSQTYWSDDGQHVGIIQSLHRETPEVELAPGTETLEVAGHPAFLRRDVPVARADAVNEVRSRLGLLPEIVGYWNKLELWVQEPDGRITDIILSGEVSPETLIQIAESMF